MKGLKINPYVGFFIGVLSVIYSLLRYGHAIYTFYASSPMMHEIFWFFCMIMFFMVLLNSLLIKRNKSQIKSSVDKENKIIEEELLKADEKIDRNYFDIINKLFMIINR